MKKKIIFLITVFVFSGILFSREMIIKADTKKEKNQNTIENHLLLQYVKNISNIEDVKYIPLDKKIIGNKKITDKSNVVDIGFGEYYIKVKDEKKELQEPVYSSWYEAPKGGMQFRQKLSIEYQVNKDYNNKNLRILKKVVEQNIHPKNKVLISASQYVNVKNGYKKNIKACIFYQSYSIQLYEKDLFFDDKITTGKVKIPIGIVFIVSKDMWNNDIKIQGVEDRILPFIFYTKEELYCYNYYFTNN